MPLPPTRSVGELKAGKGHPAVKASDDDIKSLVKWILAM